MKRNLNPKRAENRILNTSLAEDLYKTQEWADRLKIILNSNKLFGEDRLLAAYFQAVCLFRLATIELEDSTPFWNKIIVLEKRLKFNDQDILTVSQLFRDKEKSELEKIHQALELKKETK